MSKFLTSLLRRCRIHVAGARALDLRAYNPVAAVARDRPCGKLPNQEAQGVSANAQFVQAEIRRKITQCSRIVLMTHSTTPTGCTAPKRGEARPYLK